MLKCLFSSYREIEKQNKIMEKVINDLMQDKNDLEQIIANQNRIIEKNIDTISGLLSGEHIKIDNIIDLKELLNEI